MFDVGGAIGAGLGAIGSIFGGISASKAMKRVKNNLNEQRRRNQDWYDRRYNEDATQRADAQAILTRTEDSIRNRNRQAAGAQAVAGGESGQQRGPGISHYQHRGQRRGTQGRCGEPVYDY